MMPESSPQVPVWAVGSPTQAARLRKSGSKHFGPRDTLGGVEDCPSESTQSTASPKTPLEDATPCDSERGSDGEMTRPHLRVFGPLPSLLRKDAMSTKAEEAHRQQEDASIPKGDPENLPLWMRVKTFEQRNEQQLAHERMERNRAQTAVDETAPLLERSEMHRAALQQELDDRKKEAADQKGTIEELTLRFQEQEEKSAKDVKAQAEELQAKAKELSGMLVLAQQHLGDSEESGKTLAAKLEGSERSRQADLDSHSQEKVSMRKISQARLDEQAGQHDTALKSAWQQHSDLQVQLARKEAEHCESQQLVAEMRAVLEQTEADYKKAMSAIAHALSQPLKEDVAET